MLIKESDQILDLMRKETHNRAKDERVADWKRVEAAIKKLTEITSREFMKEEEEKKKKAEELKAKGGEGETKK